MNLRPLFRILWARRLVVLTPMVFSLLGGVYVMLTAPPRYEASSRVMLDIIKPDPITGFRVTSKTYDAYVTSQMNVIHDIQVTGPVVDSLGWVDNPAMYASWQTAPDKGDDFRRWAANRLAFGVGTELVQGTNILKIKFQAVTPEFARVVADNLRTAYIDNSVTQQRDSARAASASYAIQADKMVAHLVELEIRKGQLERELGVILPDEGPDLDTQKLERMAGTVRTAQPPQMVRDNTQGMRLQMAQLDQVIASATDTLGPNNPNLIRMKHQRDMLAAQIEALTPRTPAGDFVMRQAEVSAGIMRDQASKVLQQSSKALTLHLVNDEIKRTRELYQKAAEKGGKQHQLANLSDASLTPVGQTESNPVAVFPNAPLIIGGSSGLGLLFGALLALFLEALERRVRSEQALRAAAQTALVKSIPRFPLPAEPKPVRPVGRAARRAKDRPPKPKRSSRGGEADVKRKWGFARG
jgi:uncharacterized protein involved in exopolysaccharide biosynthesis